MASNKPYKVITSDDVANQMNAIITQVNETLHIPPTITRILLDRFKWDGQTLMDKFFIKGDDKFFRDARIIDPHKYKKVQVTSAQCGICFETTKITGFQCGHQFCRECWRMYLTTKIVDEGVHLIPCADFKCDIIIDDDTVKSFVTDPVVISKYNLLIRNSFIKFNRNLRWCIKPGCNYVIDILSSDCTYATCKCGAQICGECPKEMHAPITCELLEKWIKDDSETEKYLSGNTKPCPGCSFSIEKNGGCPHMSCTNCRHQFCWKCLGPWSKHDASYKCRTTEESKTFRETRSLPQRKTHCFDRYQYNNQALKDEKERFGLVWEEFQQYRWELNKAADVIYNCRHFLMYSYALIYYLQEDNNVYIFETNLDDLEAKTDKLSVFLEQYINCRDDDSFLENEVEIRRKIVDSVSHCDLLREKWLFHIKEANENGIWQYRQ